MIFSLQLGINKIILLRIIIKIMKLEQTIILTIYKMQSPLSDVKYDKTV